MRTHNKSKISSYLQKKFNGKVNCLHRRVSQMIVAMVEN